MTVKPDIRLLLYFAAAAFIICLAASVAGCLLMSDMLARVLCISAAAAVLAASLGYLALMRKYTRYTLSGNTLTVQSGVVFKRTQYLYLDKAAVMVFCSLPFGTGLVIVRVYNTGAVLLTDKLDLSSPPRK